MAINTLQGPPLAVVEPASKWKALDLKELWRFRELLLTLGLRDLKLRYRQTAMGVSWVILQPLLGAGILSFVFGKLGSFKSDGDVPFFLSTFAGMMGWGAFQTTLTKASTCLIGNSNLVSKVYFPRIALPLSNIFAATIDFCVSLPVFAILLLIFHPVVTWHLLLVPMWLVMMLGLALALGLFTSALTVQYRDVQYIVPVLTSFLMYASPVAYGISNVMASNAADWKKMLYFGNPIAGIMTGFRWSLLGVGEIYWGPVLYSAIMTLVLLVIGAFSFRRMEQRFADVI